MKQFVVIRPALEGAALDASDSAHSGVRAEKPSLRVTSHNRSAHDVIPREPECRKIDIRGRGTSTPGHRSLVRVPRASRGRRLVMLLRRRNELIRTPLRVRVVSQHIICITSKESVMLGSGGLVGRGRDEPHTRYPRIPVEPVPPRGSVRGRVVRCRCGVSVGRLATVALTLHRLLLRLLEGCEHRSSRHRAFVLRRRRVAAKIALQAVV